MDCHGQFAGRLDGLTLCSGGGGGGRRWWGRGRRLTWVRSHSYRAEALFPLGQGAGVDSVYPFSWPVAVPFYVRKPCRSTCSRSTRVQLRTTPPRTRTFMGWIKPTRGLGTKVAALGNMSVTSTYADAR